MNKSLRIISLLGLISLVVAGYFKLINSKEVMWVFNEKKLTQDSGVEIISVLFGISVLIFLKITWKLIDFNWGLKEIKQQEPEKNRS